MADVVQFFYPYSPLAFIRWLGLLELLQLPSDFPPFNVHDLLILVTQEKLLSFFFFIFLLSAPQLSLDLIELVEFGLIDLHSLGSKMLDHAFKIPFSFVELMAVLVVSLLLGLVEFIEFQLVKGVVVVVFLPEARVTAL